MADGTNQTLMIGNVGADPEFRYTQGGKAVINFRLATAISYQDANGEKQERTEWHGIVAWGGLAEALGDALRKGARVMVRGELRTRSYEKDGAKHYVTEIHAGDVGIVPFKQPGAQRDSRPQERPEPRRDDRRAPPPRDQRAGRGAPPGDDIPF